MSNSVFSFCPISIFLLFFFTTANSIHQKPILDALFCSNSDLRYVVFSVLQNVTDVNSISVDVVQSDIETALRPFFDKYGGIWLVTAAHYHRVIAYVDDSASTVDTFCAINDATLNLYIVITKIQ